MDHLSRLPPELILHISDPFGCFYLSCASKRLHSIYTSNTTTLLPPLTYALTAHHFYPAKASLLLEPLHTDLSARTPTKLTNFLSEIKSTENEADLDFLARFNRHYAQVASIAWFALRESHNLGRTRADFLAWRKRPLEAEIEPWERRGQAGFNSTFSSLRIAFVSLLLRDASQRITSGPWGEIRFNEQLKTWAARELGVDTSLRGYDMEFVVKFQGHVFTAVTAVLRGMDVDVGAVSMLYFYEHAPVEKMYAFVWGSEEERREIIERYMPAEYADEDFKVPMLRMIKRFWKTLRPPNNEMKVVGDETGVRFTIPP